VSDIGDAIAQRIEFFKENPDKAASRPTAVAKLESGLKFTVSDITGASIETDMPPALGGGSTAPTPGWFQTAAMASCTATVVAMRAAQLGVELRTLEVSVTTEADARGLLGMDDSIPPGAEHARMQIKLAADGASPDELEELARWAFAHSPVSGTVRQSPPIDVDVVVE
jgi:uncharacterized OsmC-like protein